MKTFYETNSTDLIPHSLGQIKVAYSCKTIKFGQECWERQSPWATSATAHLSDGLAKTGNTDSLYLDFFRIVFRSEQTALMNVLEIVHVGLGKLSFVTDTQLSRHISSTPAFPYRMGSLVR